MCTQAPGLSSLWTPGCVGAPKSSMKETKKTEVPPSPNFAVRHFDEFWWTTNECSFGHCWFWTQRRCHCFCDWGALEGGVLRLNGAMCRTRCWGSIECEKGGSRIGPQGLGLKFCYDSSNSKFHIASQPWKDGCPSGVDLLYRSTDGATSLLNLCLGVVSKLVKVYAETSLEYKLYWVFVHLFVKFCQTARKAENMFEWPLNMWIEWKAPASCLFGLWRHNRWVIAGAATVSSLAMARICALGRQRLKVSCEVQKLFKFQQACRKYKIEEAEGL